MQTYLIERLNYQETGAVLGTTGVFQIIACYACNISNKCTLLPMYKKLKETN